MTEVEQIREKISQHVLASKEMSRIFEFRMSAAGECIRKLDYDAQLGRPPVTIETAHRLLMGEPFHQFWRELFSKVYPNDYMFAEDEVKLSFEVDGETLEVTGHPDGYLKFLDAVTEVKSVSDSTYFKAVEQGKPYQAHLEQGNLYAEALNAKYILFLYHNRDSGAYTLFLVPYSQELAQQTLQKMATVWRNRKTSTISARPYNDATGSPCFYCDWKDKCYEGFSAEVSGFGAKTVDDPDLIQMARRYDLSRGVKLQHTKLEEAVKEEIATWMVSNQLNSVKVAEIGDLLLKIGKNNNPIVSIKPEKGDK